MTEISLFDDGLDEDDLAVLSASRDLTIQANRNLGNVVSDVIKDTATVNKAQELFEQKALTDLDRIYGNVLSAQDRLINIEDNPAFVNNIMSLLGHDEFNRRVQGAKLKRSEFELQQLGSKISRSQSITASKNRSSQQRILGAQTQANIAATESGILVDQFRLGMSLEQANQARQRFNIFLQQNEVVRTQQQIASLGKKQLKAELDNEKSKLPRGLMEDRLRKIETAEIALEAAQVTMASGRASAAKRSIEAFLANAGTPTLMALHNQAVQSEDRTVKIGAVILGEGQLVAALNNSMKEDEVLRAKGEEISVAMVEAEVALEAAAIEIQNLDSAFNGSMPTDVQAEIAAAAELVKLARDQNLPPKTTLSRVKLLEAGIEKGVKAFEDSFVEDSDKQAARAFVKNALTSKLAAGFLANNIASPAATASGNILFDTLGLDFQQRIDDIRNEEEIKSAVFRDPVTKDITLATQSRERDAARRSELAMQASGNRPEFKVIAGVVIGNQFITDVLADMTKDLDNTDPKIMANIINPETKRFNLELTKNGHPDKSLIFASLAERTGLLREQGVLKPDESLTAMLLERMKDTQVLTKFTNEHFSNLNIYQESFMQMLYQGSTLTPINHFINQLTAFETDTDRVIDNAIMRSQRQVDDEKLNIAERERGKAHQQAGTLDRAAIQAGIGRNEIQNTFEELLGQ